MSTLIEGDLLYHCIHGLCRLEKIFKNDSSGHEGPFYTLIPHVIKRGAHRFTFAAKDMAITGFHTLVPVADAYAILVYFKKGLRSNSSEDPRLKLTRNFSEDNHTWALAKFLLTCAGTEGDAKDQKRRGLLKRSARGLILELAFVLQLPLTEAIFQVRKSLETMHTLDPIFIAALNNAGQE